MRAVVDFRTLANGAYKFMAGKRRGYWRVLIVRDEAGPMRINSHNVVRVAYEGPEGIVGVTARSKYDISSTRAHAEALAEQLNCGAS